jgi:sugar/nucleoside kinase (ribokinase family)
MAAPDFDVVVVGELNPDLILSGDVTPEFGQVEKVIDDATLTMGASASIFACGVARLGLRVALIAKVGDDFFGRFLVETLKVRGVDTSGVVVDPILKTGLGVMLSRRTDRAMLTYLGTIAALRYDEINHQIIRRARHLHLGSLFLLDALRPEIPTLYEAAKGYGLTTSLDTNYDPSEQWNGNLVETLPHLDIFLPNETELLGIAHQPDLQTALASLSQTIPLIAVKRGVDGALAQQGNQLDTAETIPVNVLDTTGAGDSFDAGFIYGYLKGWEVSRCLRMGCVCGALSTQGIGGTTAQPTLEEALAQL